MKYLVLLLLTNCMYVRSPTETIPSATAYCEPIHEDVWLCREDDNTTYRCVNEHGYWACTWEHHYPEYWRMR